VKLKPVLAGAFAGLMLASSGAFAQQAQQAQDAGPGRPETKTVGDWTVRCFPVTSPNPCDMFQELVDQNSHQRILSLSIAYAPSADRNLLIVTVPLDIAIQKGVTIQTDSYKSPILKYRMCTRDGCFVQMIADTAMIEALGKSGPEAKVNIVADGGKNYGLRFFLKGFAAAHDDMVAQARAKAKSPKPEEPAKP